MIAHVPRRVATIDATTAGEILYQTHAAKFDLSRHDRAQILKRMADAIEDRGDEIARLITDESGLCLKDTRYESSRVCDVLRFSGTGGVAPARPRNRRYRVASNAT